jgi:hypothetical protein
VRLPNFLLAFAATVLVGQAADLPKNYATPDNLNNVINRYVAAQQAQQEALRGARMEVEIDAQLPRMEKKGKLRVLRIVPKFGKITFKQIGQFMGDPIVKKEVIAKYLDVEQGEHETGSIAITPANYKFQINAIITQDDRQIYIFKLNPKRKAMGLFKGELWLDGATGMPLKETGQLVKTGSAWLKSIRFVRDYEMNDGVSILKHLQSTIDVRVFGKAELNASYSNPTWQEDEQTASVPSVP